MKKQIAILTIISLLIGLTACEGLKGLIILNSSSSEAIVTVKPGIENFTQGQVNNNPKNLSNDSTTISLFPDSSMSILSNFTSLIFNVRIKETDLQTDYLRIETKKDTIIADSKKEIINLIYGKRKDYVKSKGRSFVIISINEKTKL